MVPPGENSIPLLPADDVVREQEQPGSGLHESHRRQVVHVSDCRCLRVGKANSIFIDSDLSRYKHDLSMLRLKGTAFKILVTVIRSISMPSP